jgi:hypothetical protein
VRLIERIREWREVRKVRKVFPDYIATVRTADFERWLDKQPPIVHAKCGSPLAADAIDVLQRYTERA